MIVVVVVVEVDRVVVLEEEEEDGDDVVVRLETGFTVLPLSCDKLMILIRLFC